MSKIFLNKILEESIDIVKKNIREDLNLKKQTAIFSTDIITTAVAEELNFVKKTGESSYKAWHDLDKAEQDQILAIVRRISARVLKNLYDSYKDLQKTSRDVKFKITKPASDGSFTVTAWGAIGSNLSGDLNAVNPYTKLRDGFNEIMGQVWAIISKAVLKKNEQKGNTATQENIDAFNKVDNAFNLGHAFGSSVAEKRRTAASDYLYKELVKRTKGVDTAEAILKALDLEFVIDYKSTKGVTKLLLSIESARQNKSEGSTIQKVIINQAKDSLANALEKFLANKDAIYEIAGSDNRVEIERKKVIEAFNKKLKKGIKKSSVDTALKLSSSKVSKNVSLKIKESSSKSKQITLDREIKKRTIVAKRKEGGAISLPSLMALINTKLPQTVAGNMKEPALKLRTGRFAESVKVTDITKTPQGFPSIGYTYMKYPYQTFEPGYAQGSADRDPRKLIDKSIRDVARELIIGRFYTRRV